MERGHIGDWIRDYNTLTKLQARAILYPKPPSEYLGHNEGKLPAILLPGLLENWQFLKNVADLLSAAGHDIYTIQELGFNIVNLEYAAHIVDFFISNNNLRGAILVAHSKGGIVGAEAMEHYHGLKMIAIAAPFKGSSLAERIPLKSFREMSPQNEKIIRLQMNKEIKHRIFSIYPEFDNHIPNKNGSILEGAENIELPVAGHHKVLESRELIQKVNEIVNLWEGKRK